MVSEVAAFHSAASSGSRSVWTLNRLRAEALDDLAIGIDASLSGQIDGPVWSVSDRETAGALDRVAQIAEHKHCRPQARPFRLRFARVVAVFPVCSPATL
jgi:hypothetical protein